MQAVAIPARRRGAQENDLLLGGFADVPTDEIAARFCLATDELATPPSGATATMQRPLSSLVFSRLGGVGLAVGAFLLAWGLASVAAGDEPFAVKQAFIASPIGIVLLFLSAAFSHPRNGPHRSGDVALAMSARRAQSRPPRT